MLEGRDLDLEELRREKSELIVTRVSGFGQTGPCREPCQSVTGGGQNVAHSTPAGTARIPFRPRALLTPVPRAQVRPHAWQQQERGVIGR